MLKPFLNALDLLDETGSADCVFRHINRIENQGERESTLKMLVKYFARQGNLEQARRFTDAIRDQTVSIHCLQEVARELRRKGYTEAGSGFLQTAYEKAKTLKADASHTAFIFFAVSVELHDSGRVVDALELLREAIRLESSGRILSSKFLWGCSMQLARWGFREEATTAAESIQEDGFRKYALDRLKSPL